ncbi:hypothetical protein IFT43_20695 [Oxalobacteraceae sp. CFBP 13708]|nr:hypothetical protein [Oxalobacteraceae sp. CFBP 13708]
MENRIDQLTEMHVDLAAAVSVAFGRAVGVEAARELGIAISVAQRVLLKGGPMRGATAATLALSSRGALRT